MSTNYQIQVAGFGGQGIVFLVKLMALCSKIKGVGCLGTENHGMSQRGGTVVCDIKIGNFHTPCINKGQADLLIGLHSDESLRVIQYLKPSGQAVVNAKSDFPKLNQEVFVDDAFSRAENGDFPIQGINVFMLGVALSKVKNFPFSLDEIKQGLEEINPAVAEKNMEVLQMGMAL